MRKNPIFLEKQLTTKGTKSTKGKAQKACVVAWMEIATGDIAAIPVLFDSIFFVLFVSFVVNCFSCFSFFV